MQSSVVRKEEIGRKITGDGLIAITNFHKLFDKSDDQSEADVNPLEDPSQAVKELFPITPGTSQGQALTLSTTISCAGANSTIWLRCPI